MAGSVFQKLRGADGQASRVQDNVAATLNPIVQAVMNTPIGGAPPPAWIRPSLLNGFADFSPPVGPWAQASYHRDALGYVHGQGRIVTAAGAAAGAVIFVLPQTYRPARAIFVSVRGNAGAAQAATILPNGNVATDVVIAAGGDMGLWFTFLAEQ